MNILVEIDGVLRSQDHAPIPVGVLMVGTLTVYNRIAVMASESTEDISYWLDSHKIVDIDDIIDSSVGLSTEPLAHRQITHARSRGAVELFITNNPTHWAYAFEIGIPCVMFGQPSYTRVEFRPDAPSRVRAWNDIEQAIRKENIVRTQDARFNRVDEGARFDG
jgi:hypothetical protein